MRTFFRTFKVSTCYEGDSVELIEIIENRKAKKLLFRTIYIYKKQNSLVHEGFTVERQAEYLLITYRGAFIIVIWNPMLRIIFN